MIYFTVKLRWRRLKVFREVVRELFREVVRKRFLIGLRVGSLRVWRWMVGVRLVDGWRGLGAACWRSSLVQREGWRGVSQEETLIGGRRYANRLVGVPVCP